EANFFVAPEASKGARYDPILDHWIAITTVGAPYRRDWDAAVWTGQEMIVWGGGDYYTSYNTGGRFVLGAEPADPDADGDGWPACAGDCDDADPSVYSGAPQICDGKNNDCLSPTWPSLAGTNDGDDDGDGLSECAGDCDDTHASVRPGG